MEIEVGDYIRTKSGIIRKVETIKSGKRKFTRTTETLINGKFKLDDIVKHSKNIINLLEVNDIIEYTELRDVPYYGTKLCESYIADIHDKEELKDIKNEIRDKGITLLSIVTKEQFETKKYRIGE